MVKKIIEWFTIAAIVSAYFYFFHLKGRDDSRHKSQPETEKRSQEDIRKYNEAVGGRTTQSQPLRLFNYGYY